MTPVSIKSLRLLFTSILAISVLAGESLATTKESSATLESAQEAIENAKTAIEAAEASLKEAQTKSDDKLDDAVVVKKSESSNDSKLYKWVDKNGKVSYQNTPPPKNAQILDSDVLKGRKSSEKQVKELKPTTKSDIQYDSDSPVMVFTAEDCAPCQTVVLFLTQKQVPFIERDILEDRLARERLSSVSKQITVPSLFIGSRIIQGDSESVITAALIEAGYLKN